MFKTRSAATGAVLGGRVHVNGERVKPSKFIRTGDTIEVTIRTVRRTLVVTGLAERRGPASDALTLYEETPESLAARERTRLNGDFPVRQDPTSAHDPQSGRGGDSTHYAGDSGAHADHRIRIRKERDGRRRLSGESARPRRACAPRSVTNPDRGRREVDPGNRKDRGFRPLLDCLSTKGAEKRQQHGSKGAHVFRDPNDENRVWTIFDWDEKGWQSFISDPPGRGDLPRRWSPRSAPGGGTRPRARRLALERDQTFEVSGCGGSRSFSFRGGSVRTARPKPRG